MDPKALEQQLYELRALILKLQEQLVARELDNKHRREEFAKLLIGLDTHDPDAMLRALLAAGALLS